MPIPSAQNSPKRPAIYYWFFTTVLSNLVILSAWSAPNTIDSAKHEYTKNYSEFDFSILSKERSDSDSLTTGNLSNADQTLNFATQQSGASGLTTDRFRSEKNFVNRAQFTDQHFQSELAAVVHAMNQYNPTSITEDREYIGAVFRISKGKFTYSVAPGRAGRDEISAAIPLLPNAELVAFWHTHGGAHWSRQYFSELDSALVKQWQLPFYLGTADGKLRILRPRHVTLSPFQARRRGLGYNSGYALGTVVDAVDIAT